MARRGALVGRRAERDLLGQALERARFGNGSIVLLAGEAGVGKTRLADELGEGSGALVLSGRARHGAAAPYGPIVAALRACLRSHPGGPAGSGPLRPHLALILPEPGARRLAAEAAREVAGLGESLSRRELEVARLVAAGRTKREIARELFPSPRTVDMHVRNVLRTLDRRPRIEAAQRAGARAAALSPGRGEHYACAMAPFMRRPRAEVRPIMLSTTRAAIAVRASRAKPSV